MPREKKAHPSRNRPMYPQKISFQAGAANDANAMTPGKVRCDQYGKCGQRCGKFTGEGRGIRHRIGEQQFDCAAFAFFRVEPHSQERSDKEHNNTDVPQEGAEE